MTVRKPFQVMLLCFAVLVVYYVSIFSEICLLDDRDAILSFYQLEHFNLKSLFFPHSAKGEYYRPLIGIFYLLDRFTWDFDPHVMHLENIIFHLLNVLLLYFIAIELHKNSGQKSKYVPLLTAFFFALHPMATESVNWISGRTDLLAGIGVLFATLIMVKYYEIRSWWYWPVIVMSVLLGMLAKETAIAFFFAAFFLFRMLDDNKHDSSTRGNDKLLWCHIIYATVVFYLVAVFVALFTYSYLLVLLLIVAYGFFIFISNFSGLSFVRFKMLIGLASSFLVSIGLFFLIRKAVFISDAVSIPRTIMLIMADPIYAFKVFTGAIAFYVKEFLLPYPLNLAIREIDPLYELLGILVLLVIVLSVQLLRRVSSLMLAGFCMVAPALPLSLGTVTWTAFAERYIYLAIPFWLLALSFVWSEFIANRQPQQHQVAALTVVLLLVLGALTLKRNQIWQTNLTLFKDTVQKSPSFKVTRGLYMLALYENGKYDDALEQYRVASTLQTLIYDEKFDILYALIQMRKGNTEEARLVFEKVLEKKETPGVIENLIKLLKVLRTQYAKGSLIHEKTENLIIQYYESLYNKTGDALYLYRLGQDHLNNGRRSEAKKSFERAAKNLPSNSEFRVYAEGLAQKM